MLLETPRPEREGRVFAIARQPHRLDGVSKVLTQIGKGARVVVNQEQGKYASAHDFRRAYGTRWASRVQPAVLRELMRQESIETTMRFYVGMRSTEIAEELWASDAERGAEVAKTVRGSG